MITTPLAKKKSQSHISTNVAALVRGIDKELCKKKSHFSTNVAASVRGIDKEPCFLSRRH